MNIEELYEECLEADPDLNSKIDECVVEYKITATTYPQKFMYFILNYWKRYGTPPMSTA